MVDMPRPSTFRAEIPIGPGDSGLLGDLAEHPLGVLDILGEAGGAEIKGQAAEPTGVFGEADFHIQSFKRIRHPIYAENPTTNNASPIRNITTTRPTFLGGSKWSTVLRAVHFGRCDPFRYWLLGESMLSDRKAQSLLPELNRHNRYGHPPAAPVLRDRF